MKTQTGLLSVVTEDFSFDRGHPLPLGATVMRGGVNFSLFSRYAEEVTLDNLGGSLSARDYLLEVTF